MHKLFRAIPTTSLLIALLILLVGAACGGDGEPTAVPVDPAAAEAANVDATAVADTTAVDAPALAEVATPVGDLGETPKELPEDLKAIWEAWVLLNREYVDQDKLADPEAFTEAAIRGMTGVLEDSGTYYLPPRVASTMRQDIQGRFEGIGAHVNMNAAGKLLIVAPIDGSPAEEAGILAGDVVLEVDGESLEGLSLMEAVGKIRGPRGTIVRLLVMHLGAIDPIEIPVRRGVIPLTSVRLRSDHGDRFAHIRITDFYANTPEQLKLKLQEIIDDGAEGLILDIRTNPGGTLNATIDVASQFLEEGLVLYSLDGDGNRIDYEVRRGGIARDIPMVVLINEFTASAPEIIAGALQDHNRATIIGATSFGKGSVNIPRELSNGGGISITIRKWYTPLGRQIDGEGIIPDIEVTHRVPKQADIMQLERAIEELELMLGHKTAAG